MRVGTDKAWLHSLSTADRTLYHIDSKRGSEAIERMGILEDFKGILVHDFWQAYLSLDCEHAICNAHIVRELTFFEDLGAENPLCHFHVVLCSVSKGAWRRN